MEPGPGVIPEAVETLINKALVSELTVVTSSGRPVTYPLIPLYDGRHILMTSSALFSKKLRHMKANPKVSVALSDPVGIPAEPFHRATVQGEARIIDNDLHSEWEKLLPLWREKEPIIDYFMKRRFGIPLFFERAIIEITPIRVFFWENARTDVSPKVFELVSAA